MITPQCPIVFCRRAIPIESFTLNDKNALVFNCECGYVVHLWWGTLVYAAIEKGEAS